MKVTVIDYGLSNLRSVQNAFAHCGAETLLTSSAADVRAAEALVLPGVGAFRDGMAGLERLGLVEVIRQKAAEGTPLLGICLGMQMLFDESEEFGTYPGLGPDPRPGGKNSRHRCAGQPPEGAPHQLGPAAPGGRPYRLRRHRAGRGHSPARSATSSTATRPSPPMRRTAWPIPATVDGTSVTVAAHGSVVGCQFHPEKSGPVGLSIISQFINICQK